MKSSVIVFPGSNCDRDVAVALEKFQIKNQMVWHDESNLPKSDLVVLPGGFSYGDYLRTGAIARFSPIMERIQLFAQNGGLVLGICNGFQILCEAGLLPGVLMRNDSVQFRCQWVNLVVDNDNTPFTGNCKQGDILKIPISHGEGNYYTDPETLSFMHSNGQIVFRYADLEGSATPEANPNGSLYNIAGVTNVNGNVLGMMPHPERCCEQILGGTDGRAIFDSMVSAIR